MKNIKNSVVLLLLLFQNANNPVFQVSLAKVTEHQVPKLDWGQVVHRVNSDIIRNGGAIRMKAIPFREQSCIHKSPKNFARNKLNLSLELPFFEAESGEPKMNFCFSANMLFQGPS